MDPLSVTLTVITLATALKDIIETAEVIRDSFSKLPRNYRNAQKHAEGVLKILRGMEEIYREHEQAFNKTKSMKKAIDDLQIEMKSAHEQFARLIPPISERKRDRFKTALYSFWSREKIEQLLLELRDHVDRCSHDFHLLSSLRTEARIIEIQETIIQTVPHNSVASHSGLGHVSNSQLFAFTRSTPMPMTWIADSIPVHDLSKAYLRQEVGRVNFLLQSTLARWSQNPPADVEIPNVNHSWNLKQSPVSTIILHQQAVVLAFRAQSYLQYNPTNSWLRHVDNSMHNLIVELDDLYMYEDAIALGTLRVSFWREITRLHPSSASSRRLVEALSLLAINFWNIGNQRQARSKSEEAIEILRALAMQEPIVQLTKRDDILIARNMIMQAEAISPPHWSRSISLAVEAGRMFDDSSEFTNFRSATEIPSPRNLATISTSIMSIEENEDISDDDWFTYASHLRHITQVCYHSLVLKKRLAKAASKILTRLLAAYPGSDKVQSELVYTLALLSDCYVGATDSQAVAENLEYHTHNVALMRQLVQVNPQRHLLRLANALWSQRKILLKLGRSAEAANVYQDLIGLKDLATAPPHSGLQIPSETEGDYYTQFSQYHYEAEQFAEAVYAAQNAIAQYSALDFITPGQSRAKHIRALVLLCQSLCARHQYDAALSEGFKTITMIDNLNIHGSDPDLIGSYGDILCTMMKALEESSLPGALTKAQDIHTRIRKLARSGEVESNRKLAQGLVTYARLLQKNGIVNGAVEYFQDIFDNWEQMYGDLEDAPMLALYIECLMAVLNILKGNGEIDKALRYNEEARDFIKKSFGDTFRGAMWYQLRMLDLNHINLLCDSSRYPEALELSESIVSDISKDSTKAKTEDVVAIMTAYTLVMLALTQLYNLMPDSAIATTTRVLSLYETALPQSGHLIPRDLYWPCLHILSNALHDIGKVEEASQRLDEAEKAAQKQNSVDSMEELEAIGSPTYGIVLNERSRLLFAKGDYLGAVKLVEKAEVIYRARSKEGKLPVLKDFAATLLYSRILYCTLGRHEEGLAAATELTALMENIRVSNPSFSRPIAVELNFTTKQGAWKSVQDAKDKLVCTHQNDFFIPDTDL